MIRNSIACLLVSGIIFVLSCKSDSHDPAISHEYLSNPEKFTNLVEIRYGAAHVIRKYVKSGKVVYILRDDKPSSVIVLMNSPPRKMNSVTNGLKSEVEVLDFEKVQVGGVLISRNGEKVDDFSKTTNVTIGFTLKVGDINPDRYEIEFFDGSKDLVDLK
jgi:hypothetical protein